MIPKPLVNHYLYSMEYNLTNELKNLIQMEIENHQKQKEIFRAVGKQLFPDIKEIAFIVGDKLETVSYEPLF